MTKGLFTIIMYTMKEDNMLTRYDIINVEGEGVSFLFTFTEDSSDEERDLFKDQMDQKLEVESHEYFDSYNKHQMVSYLLGQKTEIEIRGFKIRVGRLMISLGYMTAEKGGSSEWFGVEAV